MLGKRNVIPFAISSDSDSDVEQRSAAVRGKEQRPAKIQKPVNCESSNKSSNKSSKSSKSESTSVTPAANPHSGKLETTPSVLFNSLLSRIESLETVLHIGSLFCVLF